MNYLKNITRDMTALTRILRAYCPHFLANSFMLMIILGAPWGSKAMELNAFTADSGFESFQGLPSATQYALFEDDTRAAAPSAPYIPHASTAYSFFEDDLPTLDTHNSAPQRVTITQATNYGSQPQNPSARPIPSIDLTQQAEVSLAQVPDQPSQPGKRKRKSPNANSSAQAKKHCINCIICESSFKDERSLEMHASMHNRISSQCPADDCSHNSDSVYAWVNHFTAKHKDIIAQLKGTISQKELAFRIYKTALNAKESGSSPSFADQFKALFERQPSVPKRYTCSHQNCSSRKPYKNHADFIIHQSSHNAAPCTCPLGPPCSYKGATIPAWKLHFALPAHKNALTGVNITQLAKKTYYEALEAQRLGTALSTEEPTAFSTGITQSPEHADPENDRTISPNAPSHVLTAEYIYEMIASLSVPEALSDKHGNYTDELIASIS